MKQELRGKDAAKGNDWRRRQEFPEKGSFPRRT